MHFWVQGWERAGHVCGSTKLVLKEGKFWVETADKQVICFL
jgi:hypothetical protein